MFKNVASQKITLLAIDTASNVPKTGDSANITAYVSKDDGAVTVLGDTTATELDATNAPGLYSFDLTQAETNADKLVFSAKSSTSGVKIVPVLIYTDPPYFSALGINSSGHVGTVTTLTNAPSDSTGVTTLLTRIVGTLASGTHQPQTGDGYALAANGTYGLAALKALIDAIDDYIDTEVAAIKAKTDNLPATPASSSDIPSAATIADAVWDEAMSGHTTDGTYGGRIVRATNSNVSVQITGSKHVAADVHEFQAGVITAGDFATDAIAAACVSAGAANKIADHVRRRTQPNVEASGDGDALSLLSLYGFIQQAQESAASGGTLTVKKTDGTTTLGTRTLTSSASADPVTGVS